MSNLWSQFHTPSVFGPTVMTTFAFKEFEQKSKEISSNRKKEVDIKFFVVVCKEPYLKFRNLSNTTFDTFDTSRCYS